jgi:hypothetical protein
MAALSGDRRGLWRSRWAAIGAAVVVALGGGGLFVANAASSSPSAVVTIDPVRILDTRTDVGLPGPFVSAVSQKLQVTGGAVPSGATGVLLNVTVVNPSAAGFLSVRPGDATGAPSTSSLNFLAGDIVPNSVQVGLPTSGPNAGQIDITYDAYGQAGPISEVLIDVVGYTTTVDAYTKAQTDAALAGKASATDVYTKNDADNRFLEQNQPIVITDTAGAWRMPSGSTPVTFDVIGPDVFLSGAATNPNDEMVPYSLPLTAPATVGGTAYRLSKVEYCVRLIDARSKVDLAGIYSDNFNGSLPLTAEATDDTDRTAVGCYTVSTGNGTARSYALVLGVTLLGNNTSGAIIVSGVRSTWVPGGAASLAVDNAPAPSGPSDLIPPDLLGRLGIDG